MAAFRTNWDEKFTLRGFRRAAEGGSCKSALLPLVLAFADFAGISTFSGAAGEDRLLDINVRKRAQVQVIQLRGQLRLGEPVDELRKTFDDAISEGDNRFVLNLAEVPMIDSSGIGALMHYLASTKQRGGNLKLVQPTNFAIKTLKLVGVYNLFEVFEDDDSAVQSFS